MTKYEKELQTLKHWDEVQCTEVDKETGFDFITTAGHGYLVVPITSLYFAMAHKIAKYSFVGSLAIYLEEDCEAPEFTQKYLRIKALPTIEAVTV